MVESNLLRIEFPLPIRSFESVRMFVNMWIKTGMLWICRNGRTSGGCLQKYALQTHKSIHISKNLLYAQPTSKSHPYLIKKGEITPGLSPEVYSNRRTKFLNMILESSCSTRDNLIPHLVLIPSASVLFMSENIPYPFRQLTDFLYMCGSKEPNSVFVMTISNKSESESIVFVPRPTAISERWEGVKMSLKDTTNFLGVDRTLYTDDLEKFLQSYSKSSKKFILWHDLFIPSFSQVQHTVSNFIEACGGYVTVESPRSVLHKCRLIKCKHEAELMRKTCKIGAESIKEVIKFSKPLIPESYLQAKMEYECRMRGGDYLAFPPVIAGGPRANTIHYIDNNQVINDNEMVLMDAGCEYGGYCSDLARTWPVNGRYTDAQRELYDLILSIQEYLIKLCEDKPSLDYLFKIMCDQLGRGLQSLGIIPQSLDEESIAKAAYDFCPHHVSHYLGMDVHDTNAISRGIKILPGMVITVEPGIYISKDDTTVPEKYRGICIRIEDDVLITKNGVEVLTSACPKHAEEIERLMKS